MLKCGGLKVISFESSMIASVGTLGFNKPLHANSYACWLSSSTPDALKNIFVQKSGTTTEYRQNAQNIFRNKTFGQVGFMRQNCKTSGDSNFGLVLLLVAVASCPKVIQYPTIIEKISCSLINLMLM